MLYFLEEVSDLKLRELDVLILDEADRYASGRVTE
jgi:hypothetical protein